MSFLAFFVFGDVQRITLLDHRMLSAGAAALFAERFRCLLLLSHLKSIRIRATGSRDSAGYLFFRDSTSQRLLFLSVLPLYCANVN